MIDPSDAQTLRSRARLGLVFRDKWRIESLLGSGGMAAVYKAVHCNNGRAVAIKVLHPEVSMNPEARTRFLREGYVANKVQHPGSVEVLDDDTAEDGSVFIVMELLDGESLETYRERVGIVDPFTILTIADKLLDVLASAHVNGIVHRDIKPDNVFLMKNGSVKVLDFGIARLRESTGSQTMTGTGAMGTPAYMPQEQARGRSELIGPRTDLWAVGATMFTMATGRIVHEAETIQELLLAAMTRKPPPMASLFPGLPAPFCAVVDGALEFEPDRRFQDARAMQAAVRYVMQQMAQAQVQGAAQPVVAPAPATAFANRPTEVAIQSAAARPVQPSYSGIGTGGSYPMNPAPIARPTQPSAPHLVASGAPSAPTSPVAPPRGFVTAQAVTVGGTTDASLPIVKPSRTPVIVAGVAAALLLLVIASVAVLRGPASSGGKSTQAAPQTPATATQAAATQAAPTATVAASAEPAAPSATASVEPAASAAPTTSATASAGASAAPRPTPSAKAAGGKAGAGPKKSERDLLQRRD